MTLPPRSLIRASQVAMQQLADRNTPLIQNEWYVVAFANELARSLIRRTILGHHLVMYRTQSGEPVALHDRCAHRSFPLSAGRLDGDTIVCGYHGMRYDREGNCIEVPSQKSCPRGIGVRNYPLVESGPLVWGWMGKGEADFQKLPDTSWLAQGKWPYSQGYFHLPANYVSLHENLLDLTHLTFVHAKSFGTPDYASAPYECTATDNRFRITRRVVPTRLPPVWAKPTRIEHDQAARITTSEFVTPGMHVVEAVFYDCRLPENARPEFRIRTAHLPTPETNQSTHYFIVHGRDFGHEDPGITGFMHEQLFKAFQEDIEALTRLEQVLEDPGEPYYEISVASDQPSVAMRRYLKKRALMEMAPAESASAAQQAVSRIAEI